MSTASSASLALGCRQYDVNNMGRGTDMSERSTYQRNPEHTRNSRNSMFLHWRCASKARSLVTMTSRNHKNLVEMKMREVALQLKYPGCGKRWDPCRQSESRCSLSSFSQFGWPLARRVDIPAPSRNHQENWEHRTRTMTRRSEFEGYWQSMLFRAAPNLGWGCEGALPSKCRETAKLHNEKVSEYFPDRVRREEKATAALTLTKESVPHER